MTPLQPFVNYPTFSLPSTPRNRNSRSHGILNQEWALMMARLFELLPFALTHCATRKIQRVPCESGSCFQSA